MGVLSAVGGLNLLLIWMGCGLLAYTIYFRNYQWITSVQIALLLFYGGVISLAFVLLKGRDNDRS